MAKPLLQTPNPSHLEMAVTGHRFSLLFFFLLGILICYPYASGSTTGFNVFRVMACAVVLLGVYAVSFRRSLVVIGLALAVPALFERIPIHADAGALSILAICLSIGFDTFVFVVIFQRVFSRGKADTQTIFGALCNYLLLGFLFSGIYQLLNLLQPHAFFLDPQVNLHSTPDRFDLVYYSFGSMTALGATGITAVTAQARSLTVIEAILGVLYLAVLISRLVGSYRGHLATSQE